MDADSGADLDGVGAGASPSHDLNARDNAGWTPLAWAVNLGNEAVVG